MGTSDPRVFRKTPATRLHSVVSLALVGGVFAYLLLAAPGGWVGLTLFGALTLVSLLYLISAFGDRYLLTVEEVRYENCWLQRFGLFWGRRLRLGDISRLREHRGRTLFLWDGQGRRFVIDAVSDYVEIRDAILHAHRAARSGEEKIEDVGPGVQGG